MTKQASVSQAERIPLHWRIAKESIIYTACGAGLFDRYIDRKRKAGSGASGTGCSFPGYGSLLCLTAGAGAGDSILLYEDSRNDSKDTGLAGGI